jgi:hypothetical protein
MDIQAFVSLERLVYTKSGFPSGDRAWIYRYPTGRSDRLVTLSFNSNTGATPWSSDTTHRADNEQHGLKAVELF